MMTRILIVGTGLIGSSLGLALKASPRAAELQILGYDREPGELATALKLGAIDEALSEEDVLAPGRAEIYVLAVPVLCILDWLQRLAPVLGPRQLVTDVGSTKRQIAEFAAPLYNRTQNRTQNGTRQDGMQQAAFLPGHPMAGKESGGAALAEATLFHHATWLFTPSVQEQDGTEESPFRSNVEEAVIAAALPRLPHPLETLWRELVASIGAQVRDLAPERHDELCAWVSHLPQYLSTALAALLEDTFAADAEGMAAVQAIGGRALRETTRLGASPYSMWRDIALTNTDEVAATLLALEQRLQHIRENLRTPELRDEFAMANKFRATKP
jgi:prephenate dehydrogenase